MWKRTNKKIATILVIFLGIFIVSCKNPLNFKQEAKESQKAYISISANLPGSNARTVLPTAVTDKTTGLTWELTGEMIGSSTSKTFTKSWNDTTDNASGSVTTAFLNMRSDTNILLDVGNWQFTLTVYNNDNKKVLEATLGDESNPFEIKKDVPNELKFEMQEATGENLANGQIEFTLKFPENVVGQVEATLYEYPTSPNGENTNLDIQTRTDADGKSYSCVVYENSNDLAPGYYKLNLALQQNTGTEEKPEYETITTYSCLIYVAPGLLSSGSYTLESLAKLYPVTFDLNGGSLEGETTLTYNKYQTFSLPTPNPPSDDVEFGGWYKEEDFSTKIEGNYSLPDDVTDDGVTLYAKWERKLSLDNIFAIGDQDSTPDEVSIDKASYSTYDNKYGILTITNPNNSSSVWDYYVRTNESVSFSQEKNYSVSVDLKSEGGDTVVGIQAAYADMFFTVGTDWTTCTFETGFLDKELPYGKNGITIGSALASEVHISNLVITEIEEDDNLPTLAFNVTKTGIENYLNNADRPANIIEVEKTESNDGYAITINTPLASNNYDSTKTYLYNDVTLELRDYAKDKGINKVAFDFQTLDTVYTSIVADTISPKSMAWNNKRQKNEESISTIFPVFEEGEEVTASIIKISDADVTSQNITSFSIRNFKIEKIDEYSNKYFAIKTPASTGGDKYTESQSVPVSEVITIPGNNASKEFDVLMYNKNDSGIDWDEVTRFIYSTEEKTIESLRYYIGDDGKYYIQNTGSSEISCRITLTEDFTVQIEEVITTGGTTGEGATSTDPSEQKNGLAYFTKSDGNSGNISCLYIYNKEGLGLYRDLVNGTLKSELTFTKNGYTIGSFSTSYTGRVDAYLEDDIEITDTWTPIGTRDYPFTSSFDGKGHSITFAENSSFSDDYAGVFGYVGNQSASTTSISNLVVNGPDAGITTSAQYAGGIVAYSYGATISNCVNKLKIVNTYENSDSSVKEFGTGGIVGFVKKDTKIEGCVNFAELVSKSSVGGIIGKAYLDDWYEQGKLNIQKCINLGTMKSAKANTFVSGFIGYSHFPVEIMDCIHIGTITYVDSSSYLYHDSGFINANGPSVTNPQLNHKIAISNCINASSKPNAADFGTAFVSDVDGYRAIYGESPSKLYYDSTKWGGVPSDYGFTIDGKSTSELCKLTTDELSANWSCVIDETRYPLPDLSLVLDESIWQEICYAAKVEVSSGGGEDEITNVATSFEELNNLISSVSSGYAVDNPYVIGIENDITIESRITIANHIKLVSLGEECKLVRSESLQEDNLFLVSADASLTLGDSDSTGSLVIDGGAESTSTTLKKSLINVSTSGTLVLNENSILQNNNCKDSYDATNGGAIYSSGGTININGGTIRNNSTSYKNHYGGAIYLDSGNFKMSSGTFSENSCSASSGKVYGGALYLSYCAVEITGGEFSNNIVSESTDSYGGAIYILTSSTDSEAAVISNCKFESNTAYQSGGAIYTGGTGNVEIKKCNFENNTVSNSTAKGGAIYVGNSDGSVSVNECMFDGNTSPAIAKTQSSMVFTVDGEEINSGEWDPSSTSGE